MAAVEYSGAASRSRGDGSTIFDGIKFLVATEVPQRGHYVQKIENHGGVIVKQQDDDTYVIVDHVKKKKVQHTDAYSYRFIDACIRAGELQDGSEFLVGTAVANRPTSDPAVGRKSTRTPYTVEEDNFLWDYVTTNIAAGETDLGRNLYLEIETLRPRHTWQSWRDHWVKQLKGKPRPSALPAGTQSAASRQAAQVIRGKAKARRRVPDQERRSAASLGPSVITQPTVGSGSSQEPNMELPGSPELPSATGRSAQEATVDSVPNSRAERMSTADQASDEKPPTEEPAAGYKDQEPTGTSAEDKILSQASAGSHISATAEDQLYLWQHAHELLELDPDRAMECWQTVSEVESCMQHSAEEWLHIWEKMVLPQIRRIRSIRLEPPSGDEEEREEGTSAAAASAEQSAFNASPPRANSKRRLTARSNAPDSQSQSQLASRKEFPEIGQNGSYEMPAQEDQNQQQSPRPQKRVKIIDARQHVRVAEAAGNEPTPTGDETSPQLTGTEGNLTRSTEESTQEHIDTQLRSSPELGTPQQRMELDHLELKASPSVDTSQKGRTVPVMTDVEARPSNKNNNEKDDPPQTEFDITQQSHVGLDEPSQPSQALPEAAEEDIPADSGNYPDETPTPDTTQESRMEQPLLTFQVSDRIVENSQMESQEASTMPENPATAGPNSSSLQWSSRQSPIQTTQPGQTTPLKLWAPARGEKTSPIDSDVESSIGPQHEDEDSDTAEPDAMAVDEDDAAVHSSIGADAAAETEADEEAEEEVESREQDYEDEETSQQTVAESQQQDPRPWIADQLRAGFKLEAIKVALNAATGHTELAQEALRHLARHGELPDDRRGIFTLRDDADLQSTSRRKNVRARRKHGDALCEWRMQAWLAE